MTNEKIAKLHELRACIDYLNTCIINEEITEGCADEIVAMSEILLAKAYNLYPDIVRVYRVFE